MYERKMNYPCMFTYEEEGKDPKLKKPAVDCDKNCTHCAWNPEEKARRLQEGRFVKASIVSIRIYSGEEDTVGVPVLYGNLIQLSFPPAVKKSSGGKS